MNRSQACLLMILATSAGIPTLAACGDADAESGISSPVPAASSNEAPKTAPTTAPTPPTPSTTASAPPPVSTGDAPKVVNMSPAAGAKGVRLNDVISLTFSRPMDTATVQAVYTSDTLTTDKVQFSWNDAGDTLTIAPKKGATDYAKGDELVPALSYEMRIGKAATDRNGVALGADVVVSFSTLRRITHLAPRVNTLTGTMTSAGTVDTNVVLVGDTGANSRYKGLLTFSLDNLPSDVVEVEKATASGKQASVLGAPDTDLGALQLQHVIYSALDMTAFNQTSMAGAPVSLGLGINGNPPLRSSTVTQMVTDDLANRNARKDRTQYRFEYATASDNDGAADRFNLGVADLKLEIVYLAP
jgi:hypothetical protein